MSASAVGFCWGLEKLLTAGKVSVNKQGAALSPNMYEPEPDPRPCAQASSDCPSLTGDIVVGRE